MTDDTHYMDANEHAGIDRRWFLQSVDAAGLAVPLLAGATAAENGTVVRLDPEVVEVDKSTRSRLQDRRYEYSCRNRYERLTHH
jgi:hypothetical protein